MSAIESVLLDTTVVVDHLRNRDASIVQRFKEAQTLYLLLTALGELLYGAYNSALPIRGLKQIEEFLENLLSPRPT